MISLTASHFDCVVKSFILSMTIDSLLANDINQIYVSISEGEYSANEIIEKYKKYTNVHLIVQKEKKLKQFEHLDRLVKIIADKYDNDTPILFCDDDDILLNIPNLQYCRGIQYVPEKTCDFDDTYKMNHIELLKIIGKYQWSKYTDFSGYICSLYDVKEYFNNHRCDKIIGHLEDVKFMEYMDKIIPEMDTEPFIFHRLWSTEERPKSYWRQQMGI